jgi:hypothetical protein
LPYSLRIFYEFFTSNSQKTVQTEVELPYRMFLMECGGASVLELRMKARLDRTHRYAPVFLGAVTPCLVLALRVRDAIPRLFATGVHDSLGAISLALIAVSYFMYQSIRRPGAAELFKAGLLAIAFLSWAVSQYWPEKPLAAVFNDVAVALFVLDVFLVMLGWPASAPKESFADAYVEGLPE